MAMARAKAQGEISRLAVTATAAIAAAIGSRGASATAVFSAAGPPMKGASASLIPAMGRSTRRDQWMSAPKGGLSRCWRKSYQSCPASRPRTCIIRRLSSVSPSAKALIAFQRV
jgi:hypothetical protein